MFTRSVYCLCTCKVFSVKKLIFLTKTVNSIEPLAELLYKPDFHEAVMIPNYKVEYSPHVLGSKVSNPSETVKYILLRIKLFSSHY